MRSFVARSIVLVALAISLTAAAQVDPAETKREAKKHFLQGDAFLQAGAYQSAAMEFEAAYLLFPNEKLHFNIAQAYRLNGEKQKAIDHYQKYLAVDSDSPDATAARSQLALLTADVERERREANEKAAIEKAASDKAAAEQAAADKAAADRAAAEKAIADKAAADRAAADRVAADRAAAERTMQARPTVVETSAPAAKPKKRPYWVIGVVVGVVVIGAAVALTLELLPNNAPVTTSPALTRNVGF